MAVYIPSFQVLQGWPRFFLPSGFKLIMIFGNCAGSILTTCPYQMSCFRVISSSMLSCVDHDILKNIPHVFTWEVCFKLQFYVKIHLIEVKVKVKSSRNRPGVAQRVPGGLRSQIFMTSGTWRWWGCQPHAPAAFTPGLFLVLIFTRGYRSQGHGMVGR
jgi:hypothetical protein